MQRVSLRKAVEILQEQGIEVSWDENLNMDDFFSYYDYHYAPRLGDVGVCKEIGEFFASDILNIFRKDEN